MKQNLLFHLPIGVTFLFLVGVLLVRPVSAKNQCEGAQNIQLRQAVNLSDSERNILEGAEPLRIVAVDAPPMARYMPEIKTYQGIATDILCFISKQLGIDYELKPERDITTQQKIHQVQTGEADLFISLSRTSERAEKGLFTHAYYHSDYAVIADKKRRLKINKLNDLANYRVGVVKGVAFEPILKRIVPNDQLLLFDGFESDHLFKMLQNNELDVAVYNKSIFLEKRYIYEYFNLEVVLTLFDYPRSYRFYFSDTPFHQQLVSIFNRYLQAIDISASIALHEDGERLFIERYVAVKSKNMLMQAGMILAIMLAVAFFFLLRRDRRLMQQLQASHLQILEQKKTLESLNSELKKQSLTDALTGLYNRRNFQINLKQEYLRWQRTKKPLSLLIIDIDFFKSVNDSYGHLKGDEYLTAIAAALLQCVQRSSDMVARVGGEEFACLLPDVGKEGAWTLANRIREAVASLKIPTAHSQWPFLTVSIGIATLESGQHELRDILTQADKQLYRAKNAGRNCQFAIQLQ